MAESLVLTWHPYNGAWVRRGHNGYVPNLLVNGVLDGLTVGDPMLMNDLKTAVGNPAAGSAPVNLLELRADDASGHGKHISWTSLANTKSGGFTYYPKLPMAVTHAKMSYWVRFRGSGGNEFIYSKGGKLWGLGGCMSPLTKPPTGGSPSPYGWSSRTMWLGDSVGGDRVNNDHMIGYFYGPTQSAGSYGQNRKATVGGLGVTPVGFGGSGGRADGAWHLVQQEHKMNTVTTEGNSNPPADGIHRMWLDESLVYENTSTQYRLYTAASITNICADLFRGGPDDTWGAAEEGYIDIAGPIQVEVF